MLTLNQLESAGGVGAGEAHFARLCAEGAPDQNRETLACVVAVACRFLLQGHPCVPLSTLASLPLLGEDDDLLGNLPEMSVIRAALDGAPCIHQSSEVNQETLELTRPLVLDSEGRLYVSRFFEHERRLALALGNLLSSNRARDLDPEWLDRRLGHYFSETLKGEGASDQKEAASRALSRPLSVISGGPGTGKTSTVVKILGLYFDEASHRGVSAPRVLLLAPTGKAAARMMEAISAALENMQGAEALREQIQEASTIHRALGVYAENRNRFRRGPRHPLRADVVIVDEASMVDLSLMRHLVEALAPGTRLILLGDRHQLASVEAGSVLSELCSSEVVGLTETFTTELRKSYRFAEDSGIYALSRAIREGDGDASWNLLKEGRSDLHFHETGDDLSGSTKLRRLVVERYGAALRMKSASEVLSHMARFRILCAHRRGAFGVETLNELVRTWLVDSGLVPEGAQGVATSGQFYRGRLILVTQNDYEMGLFNGDVGLIWPDATGKLVAHFPSDGGGLRVLSPAQLPTHETAFALTIHKSQGSEHDEVAVVLPHEASPLLTRQLVYTGVTRARAGVHVFGSEGAVRASAERSVIRYSGLSSALARTMADADQKTIFTSE